MKKRVYFKSWHTLFMLCVVLVASLLSAGAYPASAQDTPTPEAVEDPDLAVEDPDLVMARVAEAISTAQSYTSYRVNSSSRWSLDWSAESLDLGGQSAYMTDADSVIIDEDFDTRNMQHTLNITRTERDKDGVTQLEYMLGAEIRAVERQIYARAEVLAGMLPDADVLPDDWVPVTGSMYADYPALQAVEARWFTSSTPLEDLLRRETAADLTNTIAALATRITRTVDASGTETIIAHLPPQTARTLGVFTATDEITNAVYSAVKDDPLQFIFILNAEGELVSGGYIFGFNVQDVDLSESMDAPAGTLVSFNQQISTMLVFSEINEPREPVTAPDDVESSDQTQATPPTAAITMVLD